MSEKEAEAFDPVMVYATGKPEANEETAGTSAQAFKGDYKYKVCNSADELAAAKKDGWVDGTADLKAPKEPAAKK